MATLLLTSAVAASSLTGFSLFAASLAAGVVGSFIDNRLFAQNFEQEGPRLENMNLSVSTEGTPIKRLFGKARTGGNIIWVTHFREKKNKKKESGGKGGGGSSTTITTYTYFINFAVAFCEGREGVSLGRMWADGELMDTSDVTFRFYDGSETQEPDPLIQSIEGSSEVSAYRGTAYVVFEDLALAKYGNRIPQITAELNVPLLEEGTMETLIESVNLIPSTGEQAYGVTPAFRESGGEVVFSNTNLNSEKSDFVISMEQLRAGLPNTDSLNLVISWFGTDLRLGSCRVLPKVEFYPSLGDSAFGQILIGGLYGVKGNQDEDTWDVSGVTRATAQRVSYDPDGNPYFGGTPTDWSVAECIQHTMDVEDMGVHFYPFILMDIPPNNSLPNIDGVGSSQPAFPWRGRMYTSTPSVDQTSDAADEMDAFFGNVTLSDFTVTVVDGIPLPIYTGLAVDFGYRRMVLHYALLCALAASESQNPQNLKTFYVGTELVGINRVRDENGVYVGTAHLNTLIDEVRALFDSYGLTDTEVSYAADWSEYHSHQDGTGDLNFPLDTIWSNPNCGHIAIDNYLPISDWRDGTDHDDYGTGVDVYGRPKAVTIYDLAYLKGQVEGGEYYDYFYASQADREAQIRTDIFDGTYGKDWVFRTKDISNWWTNLHYERVANVENSTPTGWTPGLKRIRFSEFGCACADKTTNQPNVFVDPKSSESFLPYFSNGNRDDKIQRLYYKAMIEYWRDNSPSLGGVTMLVPNEMCAWTWDARPYPVFPFRQDIWSDGENWRLGHWLNGRVGASSVAKVVKEICSWVGLTEDDIDVSELESRGGIVSGYVVDSQMSPRSAIDPLSNAFMFDSFESQGKIKFKLRELVEFEELSPEDFVAKDQMPSGYEITRRQEVELPATASVSFINEADEYQVGTATGSRQNTISKTTVETRYPIVFTVAEAKVLAETIIQETWAARESITYFLPPSYVYLDPGDGVEITINGNENKFRLTGTTKGEDLEMNADKIDTTIYDAVAPAYETNSTQTVTTMGRTTAYFMDLPLVTGDEPRPWAPRVVATQDPFPESVVFYEVLDGGDTLVETLQITEPAGTGVLTQVLPRGPHEILDEGNVLTVEMFATSEAPVSLSETEVRNGANAIAVQTSSGQWEIIKYIEAQGTGGNVYELTRLFRGQLGTWPIMDDEIAIGAPVVFLDEETISVLPLPSERKLDVTEWRYGPNTYGPASSYYKNTVHEGLPVAELPYPVADVQFQRITMNDTRITWKRQTRYGGGDFDLATVPLNEDEERYEIDLLTSGDVLIDTVEVTSPQYTFVGAPANFKARIYQMSLSVGRGRPVTEQSPF